MGLKTNTEVLLDVNSNNQDYTTESDTGVISGDINPEGI